MINIQQTIQSRLMHAIKNKDKDGKTIYRFIKGALDQFPTQPVPDEVAIKMMRSYLNDAESGVSQSFSEREIVLLKEMVPPVLDAVACLVYLDECHVTDQIRGCQKEGMAMGIAMRSFAQGKRVVDSAIVKGVVAAIRA